MNAISYAFFGVDKGRQENCFDHDSYLRGFMLNIRLARLLYPNWGIILHVDMATFQHYEILRDLQSERLVRIVICDPAPLTKAMLWRMKPMFEFGADQFPKYDYVICRDLDSPLTYKERLCVQEWMNSGKAAHAICDSVSHTIPMMGGMVGFMPRHFTERTWYLTWEKMVNQEFPYEVKGTDQHLLCDCVYPHFAKKGTDSIMQHYLEGYGQTWLDGFRNQVPDITIPDVDVKYKEAWASPHTGICGHIGASGWYSPNLERFLSQYADLFSDLRVLESKYGTLFYYSYKI